MDDKSAIGSLILALLIVGFVIYVIIKILKRIRRFFKKSKRKIDKVQKDYGIGKYSLDSQFKRNKKQLRKELKYMQEHDVDYEEIERMNGSIPDSAPMSSSDQKDVDDLEDIWGK
ncbi:hypothetical protein [Porphyromonas sp.]|uniref:hypothetical protein n=1 Tax=Porphyromonas sp. TaxID=1924944 RepID=UPI0025DE2619|nr:hypothetical protein [Porphyromonas sp.]